MALLLEPRSPNASEDAKNIKELLRCTLRADYGFGNGNQQAASPVSVNKRSFDLFANDGDSDYTENDEVEDFFIHTSRAVKQYVHYF